MEPLNLSISELLTLLAIKENEGKSLPARKLRRYIPGSNFHGDLWVSLRQIRNIIARLEKKSLIKKQKHKNLRGGDAANSYSLISPLTQYRTLHSRIRSNKLFSMLGLRGEIINYFSHLADKLSQRTDTPWERILRLLIWLIRNLNVEAWYVAERCEVLLQHSIRRRDGWGREIRSKGDYFMACFKTHVYCMSRLS